MRRGSSDEARPRWPVDVQLFLEELEHIPVAVWIEAGREADERRSEVVQARETLDTMFRDRWLDGAAAEIGKTVRQRALRLRQQDTPMVGSYRAFEALRAQAAADYAARALLMRASLELQHFGVLFGPFEHLMKFPVPADVDAQRILEWREVHPSSSKR